MAQFDAKINLSVETKQALQAIKKIEKALNSSGLNKPIKAVSSTERALNSLQSIIRDITNTPLSLKIKTTNLDKSLQTLQQLERQVATFTRKIKDIAAPGSGKLGDNFRVATKQANDYFDAITKPRSKDSKFLANTTAAVNEQAQAFRFLANNVNFTKERFIDYVQGAELASNVSFEGQLKEIEALQKLYQEGISGRSTSSASTPNLKGQEFFEDLQKNLPTTKAGLLAVRGELERVQNLVDSKSVAGIGIAQNLLEINKKLLDVDNDRLQVIDQINRVNRTNKLAGPGNPEGERIFRQRRGERNAFFENIDRATADAVDALTEINRLGKQLDGDKSATARRLEDLEFQKKLDNIEAEAAAELKANAEVNKKAERNFDRRLARRETKQKRSARLREDLALGAGFPLLFGGGVGSVAGGVLGSVAGGGKGGFGAQILFSALGQQLDALVASAGQLGKALNPVTANITEIITAAGTLDSASGRLALKAEAAGKKQLALRIATEDLARVVGTEGVEALRAFSDQTNVLNSAINRFLADVKVNIARLALAAGNFTGTEDQRTIREKVEQGRTLVQQGGAPQDLQQAFSSRGLNFQGAFGAITASDKEIAEIVDRINEERETSLRLTERQLSVSQAEQDVLNGSVQVARLNKEIAEANLEVDSEAFIQKAQQIAFLEKETKTQELYNQFAKDAVTIDQLRAGIAKERFDYEAKIASITNTANDKRKRDAEKEAKEAERAAKEAERAAKKLADEQARVAAATNSQRIAQIGIEERALGLRQESVTLQQGDRAGLEDSLVSQGKLAVMLQERLKLERKNALAKETDIELRNAIIKTFDYQNEILGFSVDLQKRKTKAAIAEADVQKLITSQKLEQIELEGRLNAEAKLRSLALPSPGEGLLTGFEGLERNLAADEAAQIELLSSAISNYSEQIEEAKAGGASADFVLGLENSRAEAQKNLDVFQQYAPALKAAALEQQAFNAAFAAVSPGVNALVGGLKDVVAGTKSAEEAFADFLNTIGEQLIQTAAVLIAQYIAIGVAKAFAGLGTPVGGQTSLPGTSIGSGGGEFTNIAGNVFGTLGPNFGIRQRADGGPVSSNTPYVVGEEGPELFIPGASGSISNNDQFEAARDALATGSGFTAEEEETIEKLGTTQQPSRLSEVLRDSRSAIESISRISKERETAGVNKLVKELGATSGGNGETVSTFGSSTTNNLKERLGGDSTVEKIIAAAQQTAQAEAVSAARDALVQSGDEQSADSSELKTSRDYIEKVANNLGSAGTNTVNNVSSSSTFGESRSTVDRITAINQTRQMLESVSSVNKERSVERAMENTASGGIKPIDVRYESQVINNVEYVTAEQHRAGVSQAAERGRALALQALQNSVKTRKRVGL